MAATLTERQNAAAEKICARFPHVQRKEFRGDITLTVAPDTLFEMMRYAKEACGFDMLICVSAVDNFLVDADPRFETNYMITQAETGANMLVRCPVAEDASVPSLVPLWRSANWLEREQYDMLGINFEGHPDLRRILMWDGYPYFPMRKDFPLEGVETELPGVTFTEAAPTKGAPFCKRPAQS